jgi:hypothetical protein
MGLTDGDETFLTGSVTVGPEGDGIVVVVVVVVVESSSSWSNSNELFGVCAL